jgi:Nucleotidyltransferase domain.
MTPNEVMRKNAEAAREELHSHPVMGKFWDRITLILKGSTARGYTDIYSDVDFVIFTDEKTKAEITEAYNIAKIQQRDDGVFQPLYSCPGHYNLDLYTELKHHFSEHHMEQIFEYSNIVIMHSPDNTYRSILDEGMKTLFEDQYGLVRRKYFDLCLNDNWMRQPLLRADKSSALLHCTTVLRYACHLFFLLEKKPYPFDKWLFFYFRELDISPEIKDKIMNYHHVSAYINDLEPNHDLMDYPQYKESQEILAFIRDILKERWGNQSWIDNWYAFV